MSKTGRVLIAGESYFTHRIDTKGFDSMTASSYYEGVGPLRASLESGGFEVDYLPCHVAATAFPRTRLELKPYSVVVLSDIGANTLLLHPDTFERSLPTPDRLAALREWVEEGGGLVMVGGYLSFQGIDGRARWAGTAVEEALPVTMLPVDDRVEAPSGVVPVVRQRDHPIVTGLSGNWPAVLGYNRVVPRADAEVVVTAEQDPLLVAGGHGRGRGVAFTTDCAPHWCPQPFLDWDGYSTLWRQVVTWAAGG